MALDVDSEIFVMHVAIREREEMAMNLDKKAQIKAQNGDKVGAPLFDEDPTEVPAEYSD